MFKFYSFRQSNSGGFYLFDTMEVLIQATTLDEAIEIAERETDVYEGMGTHDCDCCGPRWHYPWNDDDGTPTAGFTSWKHCKKDGIRIIFAS